MMVINAERGEENMYPNVLQECAEDIAGILIHTMPTTAGR